MSLHNFGQNQQRRNNLTVLPVEIGELTALEELFLHNNALRELPAGVFHKLKKLEQLWLLGNQLHAYGPEKLVGVLNPLPKKCRIFLQNNGFNKKQREFILQQLSYSGHNNVKVE